MNIRIPIMIPVKVSINNVIWIETSTCPKCGQSCDTYLSVLPVNAARYFIVNEPCKHGAEIDNSTYRKIYKTQTAKLNNGEFPTRIIEKDFRPNEKKYYNTRRFFIIDIVIMLIGLICALAGIIFNIEPLRSIGFALDIILALLLIPILGEHIPTIKPHKIYCKYSGLKNDQ